MNIENLVNLSNVDNMRKFLEANKVVNATNEELQAFINIFEGHGYALYAESLDSKDFIRVDMESVKKFSDLTDGEYDKNSVDYELLHAFEMISEICDELFRSEKVSIVEDEYDFNEWANACTIKNVLSDLYSRYIDGVTNNEYIVNKRKIKSIEENGDYVFNNEVDAYKFVYTNLSEIMNNESFIYDEETDYCFLNEINVKKYLFDYREMDKFKLKFFSGILEMNLKVRRNKL